jgi:hypothetical protein
MIEVENDTQSINHTQVRYIYKVGLHRIMRPMTNTTDTKRSREIHERIPCVPLKVMEILDLPLEKFASRPCHCFKISHPPTPLS